MATATRERPAEDYESDVDSVENELERLVFGDSAGFRDNVRSFRETGDLAQGKELVLAGEEDEDGDATGLEGLADQDLFFLDDGPGIAPVKPHEEAGSEEEDDDSDGAMWSDSDDERITVSLASHQRMRKLRVTVQDDVITGKEYSRRLRKNFNLLQPPPEWVKTAGTIGGRARKKRRTSSDSSMSDGTSDSEGEAMEIDLDGRSRNSMDVSSLPIAQLMRESDALTRSTRGGRKRGGVRTFRPGAIDVRDRRPLAASGPSTITSLHIHPSLPLLLTTNVSANVQIYHLNAEPTPSTLLTTLHVRGQPLFYSAFHSNPSDPRLFFSGRQGHLHSWNLATGHVQLVKPYTLGHNQEDRLFNVMKISPDGQYLAFSAPGHGSGGKVHIVSSKTMMLICTAAHDSYGGLADYAWWADSSGLTIAGRSGEVLEYMISERRAVARYKDDGGVGTTKIALGGSAPTALGGSRWLALGSQSGIVNIYDRREWAAPESTPQHERDPPNSQNNAWIPTHPTPRKSLDNLVTSITHVAFSPDGQLLAMASGEKRNALRVVHLPSCSVYQNWPHVGTKIGRVSAMGWGEDGGGSLVLAVGGEDGAVRVWEVAGVA